MTLQPPWGHVWEGLVIILIALVLGLIDFKQASEWLLVIVAFALILLVSFLFYLLWQHYISKD